MPQLIALSCTIDRVAQAGCAIALVPLCTVITDHGDHVFEHRRTVRVDGVPEGDLGELSSSPQNLSYHSNHSFEVREYTSNYSNSSI